MTDWIEVVVPTAVAAAESVAADLIESIPFANAGTEIRGDEVVFWVALESSELAANEVRERCRILAALGMPVRAEDVRLQIAAPESEWRDAWKRYFHPTRLTRQLVVVPSWASFQAQPEDILLHLDPGQAFGTGAHASTQLVLEELQRSCDEALDVKRILDVGCGSGILSIASCKLWPRADAVAIDIEDLAVHACTENAELNDVRNRIETSTTALESCPGQFDLVVANIQAHVLRTMADCLYSKVRPGGRLVLSGILTGQASDVAARFSTAGFEEISRRTSDLDSEWTSLTFRGGARHP